MSRPLLLRRPRATFKAFTTYPSSLATKNSDTLVVLSGWASSKAKTLSKYADMYQELGLRTVCIPLTIPELWLRPLSRRKVSVWMKGQLSSKALPREAIFHVFSGSSSSHLTHLIDQTKKAQVSLKGIIFDSAPIGYSLQSGLDALKMLQRQGRMSTTMATSIGWIGRGMSALLKEKMNQLASKTWLSDDLKAIPHLYLYTKNDEVVSSDFIEEWIGKQKERAVSVLSHCWENSAHVCLFQDDPEKYKKQVIDFLARHNLCNIQLPEDA
eukprot:m.7101 g.7101  ORF g.7101 m.7101 type:complete len:269 (+) comp17766_c0_seq1:353-1159(+)